MGDDAPPPLEDFESYLMLLAHAQINSATGTRIDPVDVVQQTLLAAQRNLDQYRGSSSAEFARWLRTILSNHVCDLLRRCGRELDEQALAGRLHASSARLAQLVAVDDPSPSQQFAHSERLQALAQALMSLPEDQRRAVELRHLRGFSLAQIAERMQRTTPAVGGLLQRGLRTLRLAMDEKPT